MSGLKFARRVGAAGDVRELEYCIALHQTVARDRATVSSLDVRSLLASRYGLRLLSHRDAAELVRELGGGGGGGAAAAESNETPSQRSRAAAGAGLWSKLARRSPARRNNNNNNNKSAASDSSPANSEKEANGATENKERTTTNAAAPNEEEIGSPNSGSDGGKRSGKLVVASAKEVSLLEEGDAVDDAPTLSGKEDKFATATDDYLMNHQASTGRSIFAEDATSNNIARTIDSPPLESSGKEVTLESFTATDDATENSLLVEDSSKILSLSVDSPKPVEESTHCDVEEARLKSSGDLENNDTKDNSDNDSNRSAVDSPGPSGARHAAAEADDEYYLDLVQILSLLLMPVLARTAREERQVPAVVERRRGNCVTQIWWNLVHRVRSWIANRRHQTYERGRPAPFLSQARAALLVRQQNSRDRGEQFFNNSTQQKQNAPTAPVLTERLVEDLLLQHGEVERALDTALIREMVDIARTESGLLDDGAFIQALSADLLEWPVGSEDRFSSLFEDVFGVTNPAEVKELSFDNPGSRDHNETGDDEEVAFTRMAEQDGAELASDKKIETDLNDDKRGLCGIFRSCYCAFMSCLCCFFLPGKSRGPFRNERFNIDLVLDSHSSLVIVVMIWLFYIVTAITYILSLVASLPKAVEENCMIDGEFWCKCVDKILSWCVIAILLSIFGLIMILPLSYGNKARSVGPFSRLLGSVTALFYAITPLLIVRRVREEGMEKPAASLNYTEKLIQTDLSQSFEKVPFSLGVILSGLYMYQFIKAIVNRITISDTDPLSILRYIVSTSSVYGDTRLKRSVTQKLNAMLMNAHRLHGSVDSLFPSICEGHDGSSRAMQNYLLDEDHTEVVGGIVWTWWRILNGSLFNTEGIWINTRLIISHVAQLALMVVLSSVLLASVERIAEEAQQARDDLPENTPQYLDDLVPTREMVYRALYPACCAAIAEMFLLFSLNIPSAVSTILKYRSQVLPSLGSPLFQVYRKAVDSTYTNAANMVYGMLGSAGLIYLLVGLILFLFQWPFSQKFMMNLLAWGLGLTVTIGLKTLLTMSCRAAQYRSFYRIRPHAANISALVLECWYIGLGGSVLLGRITQFLLGALVFVGRCDVAFLSPEVSIFGYSFDYVPINFVKDLLVHEAHRHPYLERLAQIYLMKLRYKNFGSSHAAAAWRQLFIVASFPWLAKYRVLDKERLEEAKKVAVARRMEELGLDRDGGLEAKLKKRVEAMPLAGEIGELAKITHQEVGAAVAGVTNIALPGHQQSPVTGRDDRTIDQSMFVCDRLEV